jgi:DNA repair protein RadD
MNASLFPPAVAEPRTLRLYQETALDLLRESLRTGHRRPILQLPTGAGKTRIAAEIINKALIKGRRAIFVIPRQVLIEQTVAAFEREGIWNVRVIQGKNFRTNPNAPVQIAMAQTLARREIPPADIVIVDECHLQFKSVTKWIADPAWQSVPFIGLSATPWAKGLGKSYDDLLMPVSIQELIGEGYLSTSRVFAPPAPDLGNFGYQRETSTKPICPKHATQKSLSPISSRHGSRKARTARPFAMASTASTPSIWKNVSPKPASA